MKKNYIIPLITNNRKNLGEVVNFAIDDIKQNWEKYLRRCGYSEKEKK